MSLQVHNQPDLQKEPEWHHFTRGSCPVALDQCVEVHYSNGSREEIDAGELLWWWPPSDTPSPRPMYWRRVISEQQIREYLEAAQLSPNAVIATFGYEKLRRLVSVIIADVEDAS